MGGAKRYPSTAICEDDGFREGLNPSLRLRSFRVRSPHPEEPRSGVSKDGRVRVAILRDAMLRMAPQDEGVASGPCSGNTSPNVFDKSATCAGVRYRGLSPRSSR